MTVKIIDIANLSINLIYILHILNINITYPWSSPQGSPWSLLSSSFYYVNLIAGLPTWLKTRIDRQHVLPKIPEAGLRKTQ